jgi:uncharacterized membrane protein
MQPMGPRSRTEPADGIPGTTARNIESILNLEQEDREDLSLLHRISHAVGWFAGTIYFVLLQCLAILIWVLLNAGPLHLQRPFDPYPFPLLSVGLAMEAVLLTSFVLIRQNAIDRQSERRNHLDLQINMLAEEEVTTILNLLRGVAAKLDIDLSHLRHSEEQAKDTPVENIAKDLRSREK